MDFFRRIGTQRHKFKLQFFIKRIVFNKSIAGKIYLTVKRGDKMTTEHQVEVDKETLIADFQNQIITFPAITLFCEESESKQSKQSKYQQKPGEIKVIMLTSTGDKKLLGNLNFDVAEYANQRKQSFKFKRKLQDTPAKLEAVLQFQVYLKFIGEASETDKSIKEQKRGQSPFDKLSSFFSGLTGNNEEQKGKGDQKSSSRVSSPKKREKRNRESTEENRAQNNQVAKKQKRKRQSTQQQEGDYKSAIEKSNKKAAVKARLSLDAEKQVEVGKEKTAKNRKNSKQKDIGQQQVLFGNYHPSQPVKQKAKRPKKQHRQRISDEQQQRQKDSEGPTIKNVSKGSKPPMPKKEENYQQSNRVKKDYGNQSVQSDRRVEKKAVTIKNSKIMTEDDYNSERISAKEDQQAPQFYFADPTPLPQTQGPRKQINNLATSSQFSKGQTKSDRRESKHNKVLAQSAASSKEGDQEGSKRHIKKTKQNTIVISKDTTGGVILEKEKMKSKERQIFGPQPINVKKQDVIQSKEVQRKDISQKPTGKVQSSNSKALPKQNVQDLEQSQVQDMFEPFEAEQPAPKAKVELKQSPSPQKPAQNNFFAQDLELAQLRKYNQQLKGQNSQLKVKNQQLKVIIKDNSGIISRLKEQAKLSAQQIRQLQSKLKQIEQSGGQKMSALEKHTADLTKEKQSLQKQIDKIKTENTNLKTQIANSNKNQSFFRQTERQYQEKSMDQDPEQQIKRLQKQKNEQLIINQQQKDKYQKQVRKFTQQLQKEKAKYKQLEDVSKADLKKLKDQCVKLSLLIENAKNQNLQKSKQNSVLIEENKKANDIVIELREKLGAIKLKICEKLNEANERQQAELMQALTDLSEDI